MHICTGPCRYLYIEQPPQDLSCNPYPNGGLILRCTISYSTTEVPVAIHWRYYSNRATTTTEISQSNSKYVLFPSQLTGRTTSRLQINSLSDADEGSFACQGVFANGSRTEESQRMSLMSRAVFISRGLSNCQLSTGESTTIQKCALTGQVTITGGTNTNNGGTTNNGGSSGTNGGTGGGSIFGPNTGIIIAVIAVVVFIVIIACILVTGCIIFQAMKYYDV